MTELSSTKIDLDLDLMEGLKIAKLEKELKQAQLKIKRICSWLDESGIIIPDYVLSPSAIETETESTPNIIHQYQQNNLIDDVEEAQDQLLYDTSFVDTCDDFEDINDNDNSTQIPAPIAATYLQCKPCYVLLPPRIDGFNPQKPNQILIASPSFNKLNKLKIRPTEEQKMKAISIFRTSKSSSIKCPICPFPRYFENDRQAKEHFRRHLTRMHYFSGEDLKSTYTRNLKPTNINDIKPTIEIQSAESVPKMTSESFINTNGVDPITEFKTEQIVNDKESIQTRKKIILVVLKKRTSTDQNETQNDQERLSSNYTIIRPTEPDKESKITIEGQTSKGFRIRGIKKRPTKEEKEATLDILKRPQLPDSDVDLLCPICSKVINQQAKNWRFYFKRHLIAIHYFTMKELKMPYQRIYENKELTEEEFRIACEKRVSSLNQNPSKRHKGIKKTPTSEEKEAALRIYNTLQSSDVRCPICPKVITYVKGKGWSSLFKRHLQAMHYFTKEELSRPYTLKNRLQPTEEEKSEAIHLCQNYDYTLTDDDLICPVKLCSRSFNSDKDTRARFKNHLKKMHFFTEADLQKCKRIIIPSQSLEMKIHRNGNLKSSSEVQARLEKKRRKRKQHLCQICGRVFPEKYYLTRHFKLKHENHQNQPSLRFSCNICGVKFYYLSKLNQHKRIHSVEKKFLCNLCGKSFAGLPNLKSHALIHSEEKLYKCPVESCGREFRQAPGLAVHTKRSHSAQGQEKNHQCAVCGLRFLLKGGLKRHIAGVHNQLRPYKCNFNLCHMSFKCKSNLNYHINTHSNPNTKHRGYNKPKE